MPSFELKAGYDQHTNPLELYSDHTAAIVNVLLSIKKEGYSSSTLRFTSKALKILNGSCNLNDPEMVKEFIAKYDSAFFLLLSENCFLVA